MSLKLVNIYGYPLVHSRSVRNSPHPKEFILYSDRQTITMQNSHMFLYVATVNRACRHLSQEHGSKAGKTGKASGSTVSGTDFMMNR